MTQARFRSTQIARSPATKVVEGACYFPIADVDMTKLERSETTSRCFWKGKASYWHVHDDDGNVAIDAAFAYEKPWPLARNLVSDRIAFWRQVDVTD